MTLPEFLTQEYVFRVATDSRAAQAGMALAHDGRYTRPGVSADGTWLSASCQGSDPTPYDVVIDLINPDLPDCHCACPSYKRPCKHALGLLMLAATAPDTFQTAEPSARLRKHFDLAQHRATFAPKPTKKPKPELEKFDREAQERAFLKAILDNREDVGPRLVYADWLDEYGDNDPRAEFIRVQCRLAELPVGDPQAADLRAIEQRLWKAHRTKWIEGLPQKLRRQTLVFHRGFYEEIRATPSDVLRHGEAVIRDFPVTRVWMTGGVRDGDGTRLAVQPFLSRLVFLDLFNAVHDHRVLRTLLGSPYWANLRTLGLGSNGLTYHAARELAANTFLSGLTDLDMSLNSLGNAGAAALAGWPLLTNVRRLALDDNGIGKEGALALAKSPHLDQIELLGLTRNAIGRSGEKALRERFGDRVTL